jgi:hypothetical protein
VVGDDGGSSMFAADVSIVGLCETLKVHSVASCCTVLLSSQD